MKLSIIIPIYNVCPYIKRCFDSIYNQIEDLTQFEVIAINDGSTDNSSIVVKDYARTHSNLTYIEQTNQGVSVARNKGIISSTGDYLLFVDPDDGLLPQSLEKTIDAINKKKWDVLICRSFEGKKENYAWREKFIEDRIYKPIELLNKGYLRGSVCGNVYNKAFLLKNRITFLEGVRNDEDTLFNLIVFYHTNRIVFSDIELYNVIGRENSASRRFDIGRIDIMINSLKKIMDYLKTFDERPGNKEMVAYIKYSIISSLVSATIRTKDVGLKYLLRERVNEYSNFKISSNIKFLRNKMSLLKFSFIMYYALFFFNLKVFKKC